MAPAVRGLTVGDRVFVESGTTLYISAELSVTPSSVRSSVAALVGRTPERPAAANAPASALRETWLQCWLPCCGVCNAARVIEVPNTQHSIANTATQL